MMPTPCSNCNGKGRVGSEQILCPRCVGAAVEPYAPVAPVTKDEFVRRWAPRPGLIKRLRWWFRRDAR